MTSGLAGPIDHQSLVDITACKPHNLRINSYKVKEREAILSFIIAIRDSVETAP